MSEDMKINKYEYESEIDYYNRLIYCALVAWIQVSLDNPSTNSKAQQEKVEEVKQQNDIDIMLVLHKVGTILDNLLLIFPESNKYFLLSENGRKITSMQAISRIIMDLYRCNAIGKTNVRRYANIEPNMMKIGSLYLLRGGHDPLRYKENGTFFTGNGKWLNKPVVDIETDVNMLVFGFYREHVDEWILKMLNNITWKYNNVMLEDLQIYIPKGRWHNHNSWKKYNELEVSKKYFSLVRDKYYRYFLYKNYGGKIKSYILNEWYFHSGEINRIMFGLDYLNSMPAVFYYLEYRDYIEINTHSYLPLYEQSILSYCGWARDNAYEKFNYIIDKRMWKIVKSTLLNLGIEVQEKN